MPLKTLDLVEYYKEVQASARTEEGKGTIIGHGLPGRYDDLLGDAPQPGPLNTCYDPMSQPGPLNLPLKTGK